MIVNKLLNDFLFFFFALFVFSSTFSIAAAQITLGISLFIFLLIIFICAHRPFKKQLNLFYISIGLYILWMILSSLFNATPIKSLMILKEEWLFCAIPIGVYLFRKEKQRQKTMLAFSAGVLIVSVYALLQHFTGIHWFKDRALFEAFDFGYMVKGFFAHRLTFGNYFVTAFAFFLGLYLLGKNELGKKEKILFLSVIFFSGLATLFTYSYGPILALICSAGLALLLYRFKPALIAISSICLILILTISFLPGLSDRISDKLSLETDSANQASRIYIWANAVEITQQNPIFGVGQGNFSDSWRTNKPGDRVHVHAHNDLLNIASLAGLPGMLFFFTIWATLFGYLKSGINSTTRFVGQKRYVYASLVASFAFFVSSMTEATFADEEVRQMLMFIWAFGLFGWAENKENRNLSKRES